ncbi:cytochrome P450 [Hypoxylon sp. FL1857]|nr:cytochrome P450 [Hypoxylon sp. FL1857]
MELTLKIIEVIAALVAVAIFLFLKLRTMGFRGKNYPPGPKTIPILGNALDFPTRFPHIKFTEWARQYGDIYSLKILNRTIVVVSSAPAVKEVLDSNGARTGNRPYSVIVQRVTQGNLIALEDMDNPTWRRGRKAIHTFNTEKRLASQLPMQNTEYSQFLHDALEDPGNIFEHIRRTTVGVMMMVLYGSRVTKYKDTEAEAYFQGAKMLNQLTDPGAHPPVDLFWPLQYVPKRWAYWKRLADEARALRNKVYISLCRRCEQAIEQEKMTGCYVEDLLLNQQQLGMSTREIGGLAGGMMDGGAETSAAFLSNFVLALINHPDVQERGQREVDTAVGPNRWPTLEDYDRLPYIRAIVDETHRFRPVFPIGLPHMSSKEVNYKGYHIPEDSLIFMNTYGIFHDPNMYEDPETFNPERFLKTPFGTKEGVDTQGYRDNLVFGAGRRICPGEALARRSIALNAMNLLWAFNFKKDGSGTGDMDTESYAQPGIELAPKRFTCDIAPRSAEKAQMVRDRYEKAFPIEVNS